MARCHIAGPRVYGSIPTGGGLLLRLGAKHKSCQKTVMIVKDVMTAERCNSREDLQDSTEVGHQLGKCDHLFVLRCDRNQVDFKLKRNKMCFISDILIFQSIIQIVYSQSKAMEACYVKAYHRVTTLHYDCHASGACRHKLGAGILT